MADILMLLIFIAAFVLFYANFIWDDVQKANSNRIWGLMFLLSPFLLIKWAWDLIWHLSETGSVSKKMPVKLVSPIIAPPPLKYFEKTIIICPKCSQKLRVPKNDNIKVKCPKCNHHFRILYRLIKKY